MGLGTQKNRLERTLLRRAAYSSDHSGLDSAVAASTALLRLTAAASSIHITIRRASWPLRSAMAGTLGLHGSGPWPRGRGDYLSIIDVSLGIALKGTACAC